MSESTMSPAAARSTVPHARIATARQRAAWLLLGLMALSVLLAGHDFQKVCHFINI